MTDTFRIGEWNFSPDLGRLVRGDDQKRLEKRASSLLELLCRQDGELVSHAEIIEHVWEGRFISPNSVAVVVADIRKALEDKAREPIYLETIPKRGYRIIADVHMNTAGAKKTGVEQIPAVRMGIKSAIGKWSLIALLPIFALFLVGALLRVTISPADGSTVSLVHVEDFTNETNDDGYAALAKSVSELAGVNVSSQRSLQIVPINDSDIVVYGNLIMWEGHVAVSLHAKDRRTDRTVWSGIASGPEAKLPQQIRSQISSFADTIPQG